MNQALVKCQEEQIVMVIVEKIMEFSQEDINILLTETKCNNDSSHTTIVEINVL